MAVRPAASLRGVQASHTRPHQGPLGAQHPNPSLVSSTGSPGPPASCLAPMAHPHTPTRQGHNQCFLSPPCPGARPEHFGTCVSSHTFRNPTGIAVFLQKGKRGLDTKLNLPAATHWSAQGQRGPEAARAHGTGVREASGAGQQRDSQGAKVGSSVPQGMETRRRVSHTHTHTRQGVCTHTPTHALLGAQKPLNALRPPAMPSGQSAQLGSRGWVGRGGGVLCLVQNPGLWVQNLLENALSSTGRGRADLPQRPPPPPPPHHQRPVENLYSVFT